MALLTQKLNESQKGSKKEGDFPVVDVVADGNESCLGSSRSSCLLSFEFVWGCTQLKKNFFGTISTD